ncbi:MAG: hypothetical protein HOP33_13910 [Verrucomicrobia bacterium]|nr:hypothetical protein [Verrucomicrobiota bacterium]
MVVHEKCPACQVEVEILLENARKQNACPQCGHTFIPRHAINPTGFSGEKPSTDSSLVGGFFVGSLILLGILCGIFVSWVIGLFMLIGAAIIYLLKQIAAKKP